MKIVFAASEAAPFVKTGGLGDVAQALPAALAEYKGNEILLFLPYYSSIKNNSDISVERVAEFNVALSWRSAYAGLMRYKSKKRKLKVYFIDNEYYFGRDRIYGEGDDGERFAYFCKAILESLVYLGETPDIIHCNDWQTSLLPTLLHAFYSGSLGSAKTVLSIHNIEYQGWTDRSFLGDVLGLGGEYESIFEYGGALNLLKGGILSCDTLTTVSGTYAREICEPYFAHGLSQIINEHAFKLRGIVNGIDVVSNNPATDKSIFQNYDIKSFSYGKAACKSELQQTLGLPVRSDAALLGIVSRLVSHKGMDILCAAIDKLLEGEVQLVVLGSGDKEYEDRLSSIAARHTDKFSLNLGFSHTLASQIYAASDIYLMPSRSEPCGLSQLLAMRYGSVPIVHETGGLKDTVEPFDKESGEGVGFSFAGFSAENMLSSVSRALDIYFNDKKGWERIIYNCMSKDNSWQRPAAEYMALYRETLGK